MLTLGSPCESALFADSSKCANYAGAELGVLPGEGRKYIKN